MSRIVYSPFAALFACSLALIGCGSSLVGIETTEPSELSELERLAAKAQRNYADVSDIVQSCEDNRDDFFACMVEYVEPYFTRPPRDIRPQLRRLTQRVGPKCERWLVAILRSLERKAIFDATAHEDLAAAVEVCRTEAG